jgi:uncharacterized protein
MTAVVVVEIVYAEPQSTVVQSLSLPLGSRVADAIARAAEDMRFENVDLGRATLGIHGQVVTRDQLLKDGDRIEIYRPLAHDPKAARRKRAVS